MRTKETTFYDVKVRYDKTFEDGSVRPTTETYVVEAFSFTEAEARITNEVISCIDSYTQVIAEKIAPYKEVVFSDREKWFLCKVAIVLYNESAGKEKRSCYSMLVQANTLGEAHDSIDEIMKSSVGYELVSVKETAIVDVFVNE